MGGEGEGVQRATADFVCFHCPLEPTEKTDIIGKGSRIPCAQSFARGIFSFSPPHDKKTPLTLANQGLIGIRQRLILPGRVQPSTFSTGELNFCVRDGNRWNLIVISTNYCVGIYLSSRAASSQVSSAPMSLTSVFGMGTGGTSSQSTPTIECTNTP